MQYSMKEKRQYKFFFSVHVAAAQTERDYLKLFYAPLTSFTQPKNSLFHTSTQQISSEYPNTSHLPSFCYPHSLFLVQKESRCSQHATKTQTREQISKRDESLSTPKTRYQKPIMSPLSCSRPSCKRYPVDKKHNSTQRRVAPPSDTQTRNMIS